MRHLGPEALIDAAEGRADPAAAAHASTCDACRSQVAALRETLDAVRDVPDLKPPPLAGDHLAARIDRAVRGAGSPAPWWMTWGWRWAPLVMVAVLAVTAGVGTALWGRRPAAGETVAAARASDGAAQADEDPSWSLVSDLSSGISLDDAAEVGGAAVPGGADRALWHLSDEERRELASILEAELADPAAAAPIIPGA